MKRRTRVLSALATVTALVLLTVSPAHSEPTTSRAEVEADPDSTLTLTALGDGQAVKGYAAPADFDPLDGYPPSGYDTTGFIRHDAGYAGTLVAEGPSGNTTLLYCIDLNTTTQIGLGYELGTWSESQVPNVGYVARILDEYFPNTSEPASATTDARKAAAVQAAIWFFTDDYVLADDDPLFAITSQIVTDVLAAGPLPEPAPPSLTITGPTTGVAGEVVGPFTLNTSAADAVLEITGGEMYADAEGTIPIASGSTVPAGTEFYVRSDDPSTIELTARASLNAPSGSVFLYLPADPENPDPQDAQKLILAGQETVLASTTITVEIEKKPKPSPSPSDPTPTPSVSPSSSGDPSPVAPSHAADRHGGPSLPTTGASMTALIGVGLLALALGTVTWMAAHRRSRS